MSADPTPFDSYHKWLGIAPKDQPPHHYRLLGIEPFEADAEVIDSATNQRMAFLAAHANGPYARRAADLVSQVAAARACLLDPQRRASYDAELRQLWTKPSVQLIARAPAAAWRDSPPKRPVPEPIASEVQPSAEPVMPSFDPPSATTGATARKAHVRRKSAQRKYRFGVAGQILASMLGLAIGYWIVSSVDPRFDFLNLRGGRDVAELPRPNPPRASSKPRPPRPRPATEPHSGEPRSEGDASHGRPKTVEGPPENSGDPPPSVAAPVAKTNPFAQLPAAVDLPPLAEGSPLAAAPLAKFERAPGADFDLSLKSNITGAKAAKVFYLERVDALGQPDGVAPRWRALAQGEAAAGADAGANAGADAANRPESEAAKIPVAELTQAGDSLTFVWLPEARTTYASALRNCVLLLRAGSAEKALPLRRCERVDAVRVETDKSYVLTPLPANDFSPPPESLRLELIQAEKLPASATIVPDSQRVGGAGEIRVVLRTEAPAVELRARLYTSGKNTSIRVAQVMSETAGKWAPFTVERLNALKQAATKDIANAEKGEANLKQHIKLIQAEISRLRTTVVSSVTAANKITTQVAALNAESISSAAEEERLAQAIVEMKTKLQLFDPLFDLAKQVRTAVKLHFRVFFVCEEQEVDVLRAG